MNKKPKVIVVMPAYNAELTLKETLDDLDMDYIDEIILVDDCSSDNTVEIAKSFGLHVIQHEKNIGYGGNQKTCYSTALEHGADIVVMLHPDYQYDSRVIHYMVGLIELDICDVILGNRIRSRKEALNGGMPVYKYFSNRFLTFIENMILGQNLGEFHSGLRAYSKEVIESVSFMSYSDDFVFDSQFLVQSIQKGFRLGDIPVPVRYNENASSISLVRSIQYGVATLGVLTFFILNKFKIYKAKFLR